VDRRVFHVWMKLLDSGLTMNGSAAVEKVETRVSDEPILDCTITFEHAINDENSVVVV